MTSRGGMWRSPGNRRRDGAAVQEFDLPVGRAAGARLDRHPWREAGAWSGVNVTGAGPSLASSPGRSGQGLAEGSEHRVAGAIRGRAVGVPLAVLRLAARWLHAEEYTCPRKGGRRSAAGAFEGASWGASAT